MDIHKKVQEINDSLINGQRPQAFAFLKEVNNDEDYSMTDVLRYIAGDITIEQRERNEIVFELAFKLIDEAY